MTVFYLTGDLMFSSQVAGAARPLDVDLKVVSSASALCEALEDAGGVTLILVDLSLIAIDIAALAPKVKEAAPSAAIVAYAPHVHESKLDAARQAGCDEVLSRGQFNGQIGRILQQYAGQSG